MKPVCETCGLPADYCDSVPDPSIQGCHLGECGYRLKPLCFIHAMERREVATNRVEAVVVIGDLAYLDGGRASGDCVCEVCRQEFRRHKSIDPHCPTLVVLCDGETVVKL